jgi:hypothetical protein
MATLTVAGELLLTRERELDNREGAIAVWDDGLVAFKCALGGCAWTTMLCRPRLRLPNRTTMIGYMPLPPAPISPLTSTGCLILLFL